MNEYFSHMHDRWSTTYVTLALYRLYLHPLARIPGPKLAAVTRLYEGYYDLYQSGQYTFKIAELHKQYGPIIRTSPYELHEGVWHKYHWSVDAFATKGATLRTADHNLHRNRRLPLNPFFSKAKVSNQQDMIMRHVQALFDRLSGFAASQKTVDLGAAFTAFMRDVVNEYMFGKEDFYAGMFIRFFGPLMWSIPPQWIMAVSDPVMKDFFRFMIISMNNTKNFMKAAVSPDDDGPRTLVHEIMQSKLPPPEKSFERIFGDMSTTTGAGFETTAAIIRITAFPIYSNPKILQKLRAELAAAPDQDWKTLEQLPSLTAIIMEAMRLAPAIATRSARIAQGKDLVDADWRIPAGTPVGMTIHLLYQNEEEYPDPNPWQLGNKTFIYLLLGHIVQCFEFKFPTTKAEDFYVSRDNFALGTPNMGAVPALVTEVKV
ncbi:cytochrome P450 [Jackrogersella minutella]|nr:cytochrome P450 [Jackrogersella minutella]